MATETAKQIADRLYETMHNLDTKEFPWWHSPHTFLPANVCNNQVALVKFKTLLADTVQQVLDEERKKKRWW